MMVHLHITFLLLLSKFFLCLCLLTVYLGAQARLTLGPLGLMNIEVHFSLQIWEVLSHYCFKYALSLFSFSSLPGIPITYILFLLCPVGFLHSFSLSFCSSDCTISNFLCSRSLILLHS